MTIRASTTVALGTAILLAGGLALADATGPAGAGCDAQGLAGSWRNVAAPEGSDVVAAEIRVDCRRAAGEAAADPADAGPKVEIALKVRCLRYECAWRPVPGTWDQRRGAAPFLAATYDEERVERQIVVEPPESGRIRLTVTTRFRTVPLEPRKVTYVLERAE